MSADLLRRLNAIGAVLAVRMPIVLAATVTLLESMLDAADLESRMSAPTTSELHDKLGASVRSKR